MSIKRDTDKTPMSEQLTNAVRAMMDERGAEKKETKVELQHRRMPHKPLPSLELRSRTGEHRDFSGRAVDPEGYKRARAHEVQVLLDNGFTAFLKCYKPFQSMRTSHDVEYKESPHVPMLAIQGLFNNLRSALALSTERGFKSLDFLCSLHEATSQAILSNLENQKQILAMNLLNERIKIKKMEVEKLREETAELNRKKVWEE